ADKKRVRSAAARVWPSIPCYATHDLETALAAAQDLQDDKSAAQVLVVSGTGSACYGIGRDRRGVKVGGWGHLLGDRGSGSDTAVRALRAVIEDYDRREHWPPLGQRILRALQLNEPNALIAWVQSASKAAIAALAIEVFQASRHHDAIARQILAEAAES